MEYPPSADEWNNRSVFRLHETDDIDSLVMFTHW